ncbi:MAG TPA: carboxypeptidase-like regulatory domain-containing protein, partial [Vicinamibacteria bacterium]|nr:carboxypeptidase-like regulatory domain-containing protein [Vicinamibacteria bacterium]
MNQAIDFRGAVLVFGLLVGVMSVEADELGAIAGVVTDSTGLVLPGVAVELTADQGRRQTASGRDGSYRFDAVPPGVYRLAFQLRSFGFTVKQDVFVV